MLHGDRGLSAKSAEPGNASYYVSLTRLAPQGRIGTASGEAEVSGSAWFDHEWSTCALGAGAVGWDWFSLQLSDGRELMLFQLRREDGSVEPVSGGTLVEPDGSTRRIAPADFTPAAGGHLAQPHGRRLSGALEPHGRRSGPGDRPAARRPGAAGRRSPTGRARSRSRDAAPPGR